MSTFTTKLKDVLIANGGDYALIDGEMVVTKPSAIGLGHYPIFNESYRDTLNGLIFGTFMNREIAHETDDIFKVAVITHMNTHMPMFNKMFEADALAIDPLNTINIKTVSDSDSKQTGESSGSSTTDSNTKSASRAVNSETPQSMLSGNADYATGAVDSNSGTDVSATGIETGNTESVGTGHSESSTIGFQGQGGELIASYKAALGNTAAMVVASLEPYFFMVYNTPEQFSDRNTYDAYTRFTL